MPRPKLYSTPGIVGLRQSTKPTRREPYTPGLTVFYVDFTPKGSKRVLKKAGKDKAVAEAMLARLKDDEEGEQLAGMPRLSQCQQKELDSRMEPLAKNTLKKYQLADKLAREKLGDLPIGEISAQMVRSYLKERSEKVGAETFNRDLKRLRAVFAWAQQEGFLSSNPCAGIKERKTPQKLVRYLTMPEQKRLKAVCDPYTWAMIRFAMLTGLRISEQLSLEWGQIIDGQIRLRADQTKEKRPRVIPVEDPARAILDSLPTVKPPIPAYSFTDGVKDKLVHEDIVFHSPAGFLWDRNNFGEDRWRPARAEAMLDDFRWHDLRHTFASRLVMAGQSLYTVAELLGHVSIKTTVKYAHLSPDHLRRAVQVLE